MRILFICSSLEPGRDGVGDHTLRMAEECQRAGHTCALVALHDPFIEAAGKEDSPGGLSTLRLSARTRWEERTQRAQAFREAFRPDWVSVHFVPYGYSPRGFAFAVTPALRAIVGDVSLHVMFHELWIGAAQGAPIRERVAGFIQRQAIRSMLGQLKPRVITTTIPDYLAMLGHLGFPASLLPLFGNIPLVTPDTPFLLAPFFDAAGMEIESPARKDWWIGLFFGALHPEWEPEPLFQILLRAAARAGKKLCLAQAGRMGEPGARLWAQVAHDYGTRIVFIGLEEQPPEQVSLLAQRADFGIAASPWQLIGKSSSVASLLDHGLPVIVSRDDYHLRRPSPLPASTEPLLHRCDIDLEDELVAGLPREVRRARLPEVAARFCELLREASRPAVEKKPSVPGPAT